MSSQTWPQCGHCGRRGHGGRPRNLPWFGITILDAVQNHLREHHLPRINERWMWRQGERRACVAKPPRPKHCQAAKQNAFAATSLPRLRSPAGPPYARPAGAGHRCSHESIIILWPEEDGILIRLTTRRYDEPRWP
jgi:hypothetical protein